MAQRARHGVAPAEPRGRLTRPWGTETARTETDQFGKILYGASAAADVRVIERVDAIAKVRGVPNAQIALAWLLSQKPWIAPIPGTTKVHRLEENVGADRVELTPDDLQRVEAAVAKVQIQGARYTAQQQKTFKR